MNELNELNQFKDQWFGCNAHKNWITKWIN